jgi:20S proteasome alpha/beta subunit
MTITIGIVISEGIVLAADSRQVTESAPGRWRVDSDSAHKIIQLGPQLAAMLCGQGSFYADRASSPQSLGLLLRSAAARLPAGCSVEEAASRIHKELLQRLQAHQTATGSEQSGLGFHIVGYEAGGTAGEIWRCELPGGVQLERSSRDAGAVWSGQREIVDRLLLGYDPRLPDLLTTGTDLRAAFLEQRAKLQLHIGFQTMTLQDAVSLAALLVRATIDLQRFSDGIVGRPGQFPTCGGAVDVAVITPHEGFCWLQKKELSAF